MYWRLEFTLEICSQHYLHLGLTLIIICIVGSHTCLLSHILFIHSFETTLHHEYYSYILLAILKNIVL
jgi:hypothetical protein